MALTGSDMALMYARSGLARSGATRSDYFQSTFILSIGGVDRSDKVWKYSTEVIQRPNELPNTMTLRVFGFRPIEGQEIRFSLGAADNLQFAGTITTTRQMSLKKHSYEVTEVNATDWTRTLRKRRVVGRFAGISASQAFSELATTYAVPLGFTTTGILSGAPTLDEVLFELDDLPSCFTKIANLAGWHWRVEPTKVLRFYATNPLQNPVAISAANLRYDRLEFERSMAQIRTRVIGRGGGGQTTAPVAAAATSIPVDECGWYGSSGGALLARGQRLTYTGRSATSGPGTLTGVPASGAGAIVYALDQGENLDVLAQVDDLTAQATLAAIEGGDGIHEFAVQDRRRNLAGIAALAEAELAAWSGVVSSGGYTTRDKFAIAGRDVAITLPDRGISMTVPVQQVRIRYQAHQQIERTVEFNSTIRLDLIDVVRSIAEQQGGRASG